MATKIQVRMTEQQFKYANSIRRNIHNLEWLKTTTENKGTWPGTPEQFNASLGEALRDLLQGESFRRKFLEFINTETEINNELFRQI